MEMTRSKFIYWSIVCNSDFMFSWVLFLGQNNDCLKNVIFSLQAFTAKFFVFDALEQWLVK